MSSNEKENGHNGHSENEPSSSSQEVVCNACGFEASFVEEGMLRCERCQDTYYCSPECLQWDWNSGGHADNCVDKRPPEPEPSEDPEEGESASGAAEVADVTMVSMDVDGPQSPSKSATESQTPSNKVGGDAPASPSTKDMAMLWEEKARVSTGIPEIQPPMLEEKPSPDQSPLENSLSDFFASEAKTSPTKVSAAAAAALITPAAVQELEVDDDDEGSIEFEIVSSDGEDSTVLKSIVEEESFSEEPVVEGSWRSRDPFQVQPFVVAPSVKSESETRATDELEVVEEEQSCEEEETEVVEEELVDEEMYTEEDVSTTNNGSEMYTEEEVSTTNNGSTSGHPLEQSKDATPTKRVSDKQGDGLASPKRPKDESTERSAVLRSLSSSSGSSSPRNSLRDFRAVYTDSPGNGQGDDNRRLSLKSFREVYTSGSTFGSQKSVEDTTDAVPDSNNNSEPVVESSAESSEADFFPEGDTPQQQQQPIQTESLKKSINTALRDIKTMYGEEAANATFLRLTQSISDIEYKGGASEGPLDSMAKGSASESQLDSMVNPGEDTKEPSQESPPVAIPAGEETGEQGLASAPSTKTNAPATPRYLQYRKTLSKSTPGRETSENGGTGSTRKTDENDGNADGIVAAGAAVGVAGVVLASASVPPSSSPSQAAVSAKVTGPDVPKVDGTQDGPRYLKYRSSLSKTPQAGQEDDEIVKDESLAAAATGAAATAAVVTAAIASVPDPDQDSTPVATATPPRYMRYRTSLAQSATPSRPESQAPAPEQATKGVGAAADEVKEETAGSNNAGTVAAVAVTAAVGGAALAGTGLSTQSTPPVAEATSTGVGSQSGPRYLNYRKGLAQSQVSAPTPASAGPKIEREIGGDEERRSHTTESAVVGVAAGVTAGTALSSNIESSPSTQSATATEGAASSGPRYLRYRNSLANSQDGTPRPPTAASKPDEAVVSELQEGEDDKEQRSGALLTEGAVVATTVAAAATTGAALTSRPTSESSSTPAPPNYMKYRSALASSASKSKAGDADMNTAGPPRSSDGDGSGEATPGGPAMEGSGAATVGGSVTQPNEAGKESSEGENDKDDRRNAALLAGGAVLATGAAVTTGALLARRPGGTEPSTPATPKYMKYRSSLASSASASKAGGVENMAVPPGSLDGSGSAVAVPSGPAVLRSGVEAESGNIAQPSDAAGEGSEGENDKEDRTNAALLTGGAVLATGAAAAAAGALLRPDETEPSTPAAPKYMKYRSSLASSASRSKTGPAEINSVGPPGSLDGFGSGEATTRGPAVVGTGAAMESGSVSQPDEASGNGSEGENDSEDGANAVQLAGGAVLATGAAAATTGALMANRPDGTEPSTPASAKYMKYRSSLASSASKSKTGDAETNSARRPGYSDDNGSGEAIPSGPAVVGSAAAAKGSDSVSQPIEAMGEGSEGGDDGEGRTNTALLAGGAILATGAVAAATTGAVLASRPGGTEPTSIPTYMKYRSSLASSASKSRSGAEISRAEAPGPGAHGSGVASGPAVAGTGAATESGSIAQPSEATGKDSEEENGKGDGTNASLVAGGAVLATGAAIATGAALASRPDGSDHAPASAAPKYMKYRSSLASSVSKTQVDDKEANSAGPPPSADASAGQPDASGPAVLSAAAMRESDNSTQPSSSQAHSSRTNEPVEEKSNLGETRPQNDGVPPAEAPKYAFERTDQAPSPLPPYRQGSGMTLDSSPYHRKRYMKYALGLLALVALPLGIGLGVSSRNKSGTRSVGPEVASAPEATPAPSLRGSSPTASPTQSQTQAPVGTITLPPVPPPTEATSDPTTSPPSPPVLQPSPGTGTTPSATESPTESPVQPPTGTTPATTSPVLLPTSPPLPATESPTESPVQPPAGTTAAPATSPPVLPPTSSPTLPLTESPTTPPTRSPTPPPVDGPVAEIERLFRLLVPVSPDGGGTIVTRGTPQNRAFQWLANNTDISDYSDDRKVQRYSLATFFYSTEGTEWTNQQRWMSDQDECTWFSRSSRIPVCDENGSFRNLDLGFNEVSGTIPPELSLLSNLSRIELSGTTRRRIGGSIPSELGLLSQLTSFDVFGNALKGQIPDEVGNWGLLESLNLGFNQFSGTMPPALGQLTNLEEMSCGLNFLIGMLPSEFGNLVKLEKLSLNDNDMSGPLPGELGKLTVIRELNLDGNAFVSLPSELGLLTSLETLKVNRNVLAGRLLAQIGGLSSLRTLELSSNQLEGRIPTAIGSLSNLRNLDLSANEFFGEIPTEIGLLAAVRTVLLNANNLRGPIPSELGQLLLATRIRVDGNDLTGTVPSEVCDSFEQRFPNFYLDCGGPSPEIICPAGACCTYCCDDTAGCECVYEGTNFEFLC